MSDAQDFIPTEAKIEIDEAYFQENIKNFADNDDIAPFVLQAVSDYEGRFIGQRSEYISETTGIWNLQDAFFRTGLNDSAVQSQKSKGANEPSVWERAKTGTTQFYRQVRQKAANGYAVQTSKDMPFKYEALRSDDDPNSTDHADKRSRDLNLLAKWSMKADKFDIKSIEFWTQLGKNGNAPVIVEWIQRRGKKTVSIPQFDADGVTVIDYNTEEIDTVVENRPTVEILPIEGVMADTAIGNIQNQECVIVASVVGMKELVNGIRTGLYRKDLLEDIGRAQQWDGFSGGFENEDDKKQNRGMEDRPTQTGTGQYLKREVFINIPVDEEKETWDEMKNVPERYRVTMFGNSIQNSVLARVERNQEPDDSIPIEMIHANPDDSDLLYHISDFEVVRSNMATETTIIRQIVDNNTLVNKQPLKEVAGEVQGNTREFGPNARFIVDNPNSISEFNIRDISQSSLQVLNYLKDDSNTANSIDKNMVGESFGARTSASEAGTIAGNSRRPNLVNIEYILNQYLGFIAQRYKVLWEAYGRKEQVVQITDENDTSVLVRPDDIAGEFDIVIDVMDDIKDKAVESQRMINYAQLVGSTPQLSQTTNWALLHTDIAEEVMGTSKYVIPNNEGDAVEIANMNIAKMLNNGEYPQLNENMNLQKHLDIYKAERTRWTGNEEQNPNVDILDQVIAQIEQRISAPQGGGGSQAQPQVTEAMASGQLQAGATGGV